MRSMLFVLFIAVVCISAEESPQLSGVWGTDLNIVDLADRLGFYSYLLAAKETGLTETLRTSSPITLFIPTNDAFLLLDQTTRDFWAADPVYYKRLMMYHILQGAYTAENLTNEHLYPTIEGSMVRIDSYNSTTPTPFKDYANSQIIRVNYKATNGYIHVLSDVVLEIENMTALARLAGNGQLTAFYNATSLVKGLRDMLNSTEAHTIFAPTNAAIDKLQKDIWSKLLLNETALAEVLNNHITNQTYFSNGLVQGDVLPTLNKLSSLTVGWKNEKLYISGAQVIEGNIAVTNGVIHVIDTVLLPKVMSQ